jgi:phi13 family phage major tail protein
MAKVLFGLRNVYYSIITEGDNNSITYDTPVALPGAVNLSLSPEGDENVFYADDSRYYVVSTNSGYSGDLEIAMITDAFAENVLGNELDSNKLMVESKDGKHKSIALMFEVQSDESARRYVFYNVSIGRVSTNAATTEESTTVQTATLNITAAAAKDTGYVRAYTTDLTPDATYNAWFSSVQVPSMPNSN